MGITVLPQNQVIDARRRDVPALCSSISQLTDDPDLCRRLGKNAREASHAYCPEQVFPK